MYEPLPSFGALASKPDYVPITLSPQTLGLESLLGQLET
jgi:hypothetical protein